MSMVADVYRIAAADAARMDGDQYAKLLAYDNREAVRVELEKSWHGLHYLLTGSAWDAAGPLAFLAAGGEAVAGADGGYGPARLLSVEETRQVHSALSSIGDEQLWSRFDAEDMFTQGVYPEIWDEPEEELKDEYLSYFQGLKKLVAEAAGQGDCLLVYLS